ncbi:MAG TPA: metal-dependent transcriptional regulator, partial [Gammaproteobacteria bacterium]|nr:metal-dependent transcriptional regulator [Gammaproteobacteria bacterium]
MTNSKSKSKKPSNSANRLSMSAENYLLSIYRLDEQDTRVTLTVLSEHLKTLPVDEGMGTSLPSVGGMIRRMVREGLLENTSQKDVVLTNSGRKSAESIVRRHRLAERLVVDLLGLDLHLAHIEAHRLEHAISPILEEKIVAALNNPGTCPFGHPIPGSGYKGDSRARALDQASAGDRLIIDSIPEDDQALLEYLVGNKLVPGQLVTVKETAVTRGVVTL